MSNCSGSNYSSKNNIIAFNHADYGGGIYSSSHSYSDFYLNEPDNFGGGTAGTGDINRDPLFADAASGDYHLKSEIGRWDSNSKSWVIDQQTSFCIDAGDPGDNYSAEPPPNGGRINIGAYGGTAEASKSNVGYILTLLNPNGGEKITAGEIYLISWSSNYPGGDVVIEYSTDNGQNWSVIATTEDIGSYEWLVPSVISEQCLIRITSVTYPAVYDVSDDVFQIYEPLLSITEPNGGEAILKGTTYEISWWSGLPAGDVLIEYSADNGQHWSDLITVEDTGSYQWHVGTAPSNQYLLRITDANDTDVSDTSDSIFSVYSCSGQVAGDLNADCFVDSIDFAILAKNWLNVTDARTFYCGLDDDPNWTTQGQWEFGHPTGAGGAEWGNPDPISGNTGGNVYGVNLDGDYNLEVGGPYNLTAGPFDCGRFHDIKLRFARWLNTDLPGFVSSRVEASNDGANWYPVWEHTDESDIADSNWQIVEYDVSGTADNQPTVYFRWTYEVLDERAYPYSGWNIDDIELLGKP